MKQHYIPRCYLKRFSDNERCIHTYDKLRCRQYNASMMSVCCEDDLYTMSNEYVRSNNEEGKSTIDKLSIESEHFAKTVEPLYSQILNQVDEIKEEWMTGKDYYRLMHVEKKELALHIVTQYFRLPQIGDSMVDDYVRMEKAELDMIKHIMSIQSGKEEFKKLEIGIKCEKPALHASLSYLNYETLMSFAETIANNIFVFWVCPEKKFYTSDFPIVVSPHVEDIRPMYMGLAQYGGELTIPLSPENVLSVYDREYFKDKESLDGSFIKADAKEVRRQNLLRYFYASRHVFSYKNDFSLIDSYYGLYGKHMFMKPNQKTEIVSGLGRY